MFDTVPIEVPLATMEAPGIAIPSSPIILPVMVCYWASSEELPANEEKTVSVTSKIEILIIANSFLMLEFKIPIPICFSFINKVLGLNLSNEINLC